MVATKPQHAYSSPTNSEIWSFRPTQRKLPKIHLYKVGHFNVHQTHCFMYFPRGHLLLLVLVGCKVECTTNQLEMRGGLLHTTDFTVTIMWNRHSTMSRHFCTASTWPCPSVTSQACARGEVINLTVVGQYTSDICTIHVQHSDLQPLPNSKKSVYTSTTNIHVAAGWYNRCVYVLCVSPKINHTHAHTQTWSSACETRCAHTGRWWSAQPPQSKKCWNARLMHFCTTLAKR